jgi:hypothetical protein
MVGVERETKNRETPLHSITISLEFCLNCYIRVVIVPTLASRPGLPLPQDQAMSPLGHILHAPQEKSRSWWPRRVAGTWIWVRGINIRFINSSSLHGVPLILFLIILQLGANRFKFVSAIDMKKKQSLDTTESIKLALFINKQQWPDRRQSQIWNFYTTKQLPLIDRKFIKFFFSRIRKRFAHPCIENFLKLIKVLIIYSFFRGI